MEQIKESIKSAMEKLKQRTRPERCWCGGDAVILRPDNEFVFDYMVYCQDISNYHCYAVGETEHKAILNWNSMQKKL